MSVTTVTDEPVRVLDKDVYDTLEFSALVYGGIGARAWLDRKDTPFCIGGHADLASDAFRDDYLTISAALGNGFIDANNAAVHAINRRKGRKDIDARAPWEEYCAELNIVRGE
jgi:hypothetical protein